MDNISFLLSFLYYYGVPLILVLSIIFGFIIIGRKDAPTKLLGVWIVTWSIANLLQFASGTIGMLFGMENFRNYMSISGITGSILGAVGLFALFLYAKLRYRAKGLIAAIIIKVAEAPLTMGFSYLWNLRSSRSDLTAEQFAYASTILKESITLIVLIIIFCAYAKNRKSETNIRAMWLFTLLLVLYSAATICLNTYTIISLRDNNIMDIAGNTYDSIQLLLGIFPVVIEFIAAVYILAKGRRPFARKKGA